MGTANSKYKYFFNKYSINSLTLISISRFNNEKISSNKNELQHNIKPYYSVLLSKIVVIHKEIFLAHFCIILDINEGKYNIVKKIPSFFLYASTFSSLL